MAQLSGAVTVNAGDPLRRVFVTSGRQSWARSKNLQQGDPARTELVLLLDTSRAMTHCMAPSDLVHRPRASRRPAHCQRG